MKKHTDKTVVFALKSPFRDPVRCGLFRLTRGLLERALGLDKLERIYNRSLRLQPECQGFPTATLLAMNISLELEPGSLKNIPEEGPLVVVANHPFGGVEGVALLSLLRSVRPDTKVLANYMIQRMPEMAEHCIYVDPFGGSNAPRRNVRPMREAMTWLRDGHVLASFPSGEVSHVRLSRRRVCDPRWSPHVGRLVRKMQVDVLPVFFCGRNSNLFQLLGLIHPRFRTAMLAHELARRQDRPISVRIGGRVPFKRLEKHGDDASLIDYLRFRTYFQGCTDIRPKRAGKRRRCAPIAVEDMEPVVGPQPREDILQEVRELSSEGLLVENKYFCVFIAPAHRIPCILREIGRLRELTFRTEGEGTGKSIDLDAFDVHYQHLFLWHKDSERIVGAYRMAKADRILKLCGRSGLYTNTLFKFRPKLWKQLGPSWEMGRSFICSDFQRNPAALLLMWKGIGCVVKREPEYKSLFGPVSINNEYRSVSRELMAAFLKLSNYERGLAKLVKARNPLRTRPSAHTDGEVLSRAAVDLDDVSNLVAEVEENQRGVPVLLKQYLRLGGKLIGFNIDPDFQDVLDGLIWVDLSETDPRLLEKFFGKEGAREFFRFHGKA